MTSYQKRMIVYILWYCLITLIGIQIYQMGLDGNTQGARCSADSWHIGDVYQWIWDKQPCQFTADFLVGYLFYFIIYIFFDYIRQLILKINPSVLWRCVEVGGWCFINWIYLLWLTKVEYGTLNMIMWLTSLFGVMLFFFPFFLVALGMKFLKTS